MNGTERLDPQFQMISKNESCYSSNYLTSILVGKTGAGKTTLINQLCDLDRKAGVGESQTRDISLCLVAHGDAFAIIDTPGTDADEDVYKYSFLLYHALTTKSMHGIFLVVKYENRHSKIVNAYTDLKAMLPESCSRNLFLIITFWDEATKPTLEYSEILRRFADVNVSADKIIFKGEDSKAKDISMEMYKCLRFTSSIHVHLSKEDFFLNFQIVDETKKGYTEYKKAIQKLHQTYKEGVASYLKGFQGTAEDRDDFLHYTIVDFKLALTAKLDEFTEKYKSTMDQLEWYSLHIKLQKMCVALCYDFSDSLQGFMTSNLNDPNDIRNLIKRCPNCNLVWVKVEGCDGETTCGNRPSSYFDTMKKVFPFRYNSKWLNGSLLFERISSNWKAITKQASVSKQNEKYIGCGAKFEWRSLPRLQENEIKELFNATTIDQVLSAIKDPVFVKTTQEYEKKILSEVPDNLK